MARYEIVCVASYANKLFHRKFVQKTINGGKGLVWWVGFVECRPRNGRQLFLLAFISISMVVSIVQTLKAKLEKRCRKVESWQRLFVFSTSFLTFDFWKTGVSWLKGHLLYIQRMRPRSFNTLEAFERQGRHPLITHEKWQQWLSTDWS